MLPPDLKQQVRLALAEDVGIGDITADLIPADAHGRATVISREHAVVCGIAWFDECFLQLDADVHIEWSVQDGTHVQPGQQLCSLTGPARALLTGERTALNFLQTLSGTATLTRRYADALRETHAQVLDTRKTIPGLRLAQKYAVACGGGKNHRKGLYDAVLIKENHIMACGSIRAAIKAARQHHPGTLVEVEVETFDELNEAVSAGPDVIMLDNFSLEDIRIAVARTARRVKLEASGNVDLSRIRAIAETGVDFISVGLLTKDIKAIDLSMRFRQNP